MWPVKQKLRNTNIGAQAIIVLLVLLSLLFLHTWMALLIVTLLSLLIAAYFGLLIPLLKRLLPIIYLGSVIILLHTLVNPHNRHYLFIFGREGFNYGLITALRLLGIVTVTQIFMLMNPLRKIISALSWIHPDLGTVLGLVLSILPVIREQMEVTLNVQIARGLRVGKYPWQRIRAYLAVMIPIIIKSLIRAQIMAQLLHVRGYNSRREKREIHWGGTDKLVIASGLCFFLISLWVWYRNI
ncbi:MAG TPA: energy-coupling factor transporter transmembrane component T [Desulfosporosinus sp.]|nr:energy-coupling factor transporter transmembrane component T [Desulfosporosinus sp.]